MVYLLDSLVDRAGEFILLRRDLHRHPELAYEEHRTSALVAAKLEAWGYEVERGIGGTGVVGRLKLGDGQRRLGLRAEMDALPIAEATGLAWASERPGLMHACGHDGHTTMLLAAARQIAERRRFNGTLNLIFQPAEEGAAGAARMMADGLFERYPCDAIFAMHNLPGFAAGHLAVRIGAAMASSDYATVTLTGVGGHGAMPHQTTDTVVAAAAIVMALQTVVARNVDPRLAGVITVGAIHAGEANNVVPDTARLELSVRAIDRGVRQLLEERIRTIVTAQADSLGVTARIDWRAGYPVLVNTEDESRFALDIAEELLGTARVERNGPAQTASEDFAYMLEAVPGCYLFIGNGDGEGFCAVHNPGFDFNDDNVAVGGAYWTLLAERFLVD